MAQNYYFSKEYNIISGLNDKLSSLGFADTQDNVKRMNPCFHTNTFAYLNNNLQDKDEDNDLITQEMNDWYIISSVILIVFFLCL